MTFETIRSTSENNEDNLVFPASWSDVKQHRASIKLGHQIRKINMMCYYAQAMFVFRQKNATMGGNSGSCSGLRNNSCCTDLYLIKFESVDLEKEN